MKKAIFSVMAVIVLICTLGFSADGAAAAGSITYTGAHFVWGKGIAFVFEASGYRNRDVKDASLFVGSDFYDLHCTVNKKEEKIVCVAGGGLTRYAGTTGIVYLAGHVFYVMIPGRPSLPSGNVPLSCPQGTEPGADVTFLTGGGAHHTEFIPGSTLADVRRSAESMVDGSDFVAVESIGPLHCGVIGN